MADRSSPTRPLAVLFLARHVDAPEAEMILRLHRAGDRVALMADPERRFCQPLLEAGIPVADLRARGWRDADAVRAISRHLDEGPWDILHGLDNTALANGLRAARGRRLRVVAYRGAMHVSWRAWWMYRFRRVDAIACISEAVRGYLRARGIPARRLVVIHKGLAPEAYRPAPRAVLAQWGIPASGFVVGCAANLRAGKGIDVLIRAFSRFAVGRDAWLLLAGEVRDARLPRLARALPAGDRIVFAGWRADAPALMGACDVFVMPTSHREGLGKAVLEAMAQGVPAVVTDAGGLPEIVSDGHDGRVVPRGNASAVANALSAMANLSPERRREMGAKAAETIRSRFHVGSMVQAYRRLYLRLLDN